VGPVPPPGPAGALESHADVPSVPSARASQVTRVLVRMGMPVPLASRMPRCVTLESQGKSTNDNPDGRLADWPPGSGQRLFTNEHHRPPADARRPAQARQSRQTGYPNAPAARSRGSDPELFGSLVRVTGKRPPLGPPCALRPYHAKLPNAYRWGAPRVRPHS